MKISTLLLRPYLIDLQRQLQDVQQKIEGRPAEEASALHSLVYRKIKELDGLNASLASLDSRGETRVPSNVYDSFRKSKLDLRFLRRKWLRLISNEARNRKIREKRSHVSTFAA